MRPALFAGAALVGLAGAAALLSMLWVPYDVGAIDVAQRFAPASGAHPLGTDQLGRDVASLLMAGAQTSLAVSLLAVGAAMIVGVPLGLAASARPGLVDGAAMRGSDLVFAFPALLTAVMLAAVLGPGRLDAILAIAIFNVPVFARVSRGAAQGLWLRDFVAAARLSGKSDVRIAFEHILPNILPVLLVQASVQMSLALIAEAGLSYVGLGVQPPEPSWGRMLAEAQTLIGTAPRLMLLPGLAITGTVLGFTLLGDGLGQRLGVRG